MQEKIERNQNFLERTDCLALKMGISLRELGPKIGLSQASLFGYRSGKMPITYKAWHKLTVAEKAAGIEPEIAVESAPVVSGNRLQETTEARPMSQEDHRLLLEDIIRHGDAAMIREHLTSIAREINRGDLARAGALSVLLNMVRSVRPEILAGDLLTDEEMP